MGKKGIWSSPGRGKKRPAIIPRIIIPGSYSSTSLLTSNVGDQAPPDETHAGSSDIGLWLLMVLWYLVTRRYLHQSPGLRTSIPKMKRVGRSGTRGETQPPEVEMEKEFKLAQLK